MLYLTSATTVADQLTARTLLHGGLGFAAACADLVFTLLSEHFYVHSNFLSKKLLQDKFLLGPKVPTRDGSLQLSLRLFGNALGATSTKQHKRVKSKGSFVPSSSGI
jgi:hypothetical protein